MKTFCCECGRPVRQKFVGGRWIPERCLAHPQAKRYTFGFAQRAFAAMRQTVAAAKPFVFVRPARVVQPALIVSMPQVRQFSGGVE